MFPSPTPAHIPFYESEQFFYPNSNFQTDTLSQSQISDSRPATPAKRKLTDQDVERIANIIRDTFPEGMNINWSIVYEKFGDSSADKKMLQSNYYSYIKTCDPSKKRKCNQSLEQIVRGLYGDNAHHTNVNWNRVTEEFKTQNKYTEILDPERFKRQYETLHGRDEKGRYLDARPIKNIRPAVKTIIKKAPTWTDERVRILLEIIEDTMNRGKIPWSRVECLFNHRISRDQEAEYFDAEDLQKKYAEIKEQENKGRLPSIASLFPELPTWPATPSKQPFWTKEREEAYIKILKKFIPKKGPPSWINIEWAVNKLFLKENGPYIERKELKAKFQEMKQRGLFDEIEKRLPSIPTDDLSIPLLPPLFNILPEENPDNNS